jgi:hypothetical protein
MNFRPAFFLLLGLVGSATSVSAGSKSVPKVADFSVAGIKLNDAKSSQAVLGREISSETDPALIEDNTEMPHAMAINKAGTQVLTFYFHYGGEVMAFSEFKVSLTSETKLEGKPIKRAGVTTFVTGKGIKLGLSETQLIKILGPPQEKSSTNEGVVLDYRIKDPETSELLGYPSETSITAPTPSKPESSRSFALDFIIHDSRRSTDGASPNVTAQLAAASPSHGGLELSRPARQVLNNP